MSTETIYAKYWSALVAVEAVMVPQDAAIALALRLAIADAFAAGGALADDLAAIVASQAQPERSPADQRYAEQLQAQISRLNEWLQAHEAGLYISPGDTADAVLAALGNRDQRIAELHVDMENADEEVAGLRQQRRSAEQGVPGSGRDRPADAAERHRCGHVQWPGAQQGNGVDPTPAAQPDASWGRNHPAWQALPAGDLAVIDQLASGATTFRKLAKTLRRDLVIRVLRSLAADGKIKPLTYDTWKPAWMPTSGAVVMLSETGRWSSLLDMALGTAHATAA